MTAPTPRVVTGRQAAELLDVPPKRVAKWIEDAKVMPVGLVPGRSRGGRGVPTFRLEDFRPLAEAYHARTKARA
jgi:hypothetical protein